MECFSQSGDRTPIKSIVLCATLLVLGATHSANAQVGPFQTITSFLYTTGFVCGQAEETSDVQSSGNALQSPYDDLEPGSYSMFLNVQNTGPTPRTISFQIAAQGLPNNLFIEAITLAPFESRRFGCLNFMDEVRDNWPSTLLLGQAIQGTVFFIQGNDAIDLIATQTYSTPPTDTAFGSGGVSVDVTRETPRDLGRLVFVPFPLSP